MLKRFVSLLLLVAMLLTLVPGMCLDTQAATYTTADWNALRNNWKVSIVGDDTVDWTDPEIQKIVGVASSTTGLTTSGISYNGGKYWMDLEANRSNSGRVFGSTNITITIPSDTMRKQFVYLMYMAKAYGTRGTSYTYKDSSGAVVTKALYQNQELRDAYFYGLEKATGFYNYDRWYAQKTSSTASTYYSWWNWAFGAPDEILQSLLIMYPYKTTAEKNTANKIIATCRELIDTIRPNGTPSDTSETNLAHRRTRLRICGMIAALKQDTTLMEETRTNLLYFLDRNPGGNGVQADGSYICHDYYSLEGTYGTQNLGDRIISSYFVMAGTAFELTSEKKHNQFDWIMETFMPIMHNGVMMMLANGRYPYNGIGYAKVVIRTALQLIGCFEPQDDLQLIQFLRSIVVGETEAETQKAYSSIAVALGDVYLVQRLKEVVFDHAMPGETLKYAQMRYSTDRAVQHRENYSVGLAMSSRRLGTHESINGANRYGFYTGDGALYIYNDTTNYAYDQYGSAFNRFANMYRLPGTTEENSTARKPVSQKMVYFPGMTYTASGWTQATNKDGVDAGAFVGGVEFDDKYITAAFDFEAYSWSSAESTVEKTKIKSPVDRNNLKQVLTSDLSAKKSYFMFDDEIVCVGSDIDFSTRSNSVYTFVDNRELLEKTTVDGITTYGTNDVIVDGVMLEKTNSFSSPKSYTDPKWIYQEGFGGYVFPNGGKISVNKTFRQSTNDGNDSNDDWNKYNLTATPINSSNSFLEIWVDHGSKPTNGSYSYIMLPEKTAEEVRGYATSPDIKIVKNTTSLHVVKEQSLGITAMVFWKAGTYGDITVDKPMILMVQEKDGLYSISASDPTQELSTGTITINRALHATDVDSEITVSGTGKMTLKVNFSKAAGKTISAEFSAEALPYLMFDFNSATSGKYKNSTYSFKNYASASNWATAKIDDQSVTIKNGTMSFPLTTEKDSSGNPSGHRTYIQPSDSVTNYAWASDYTSNTFLNFKASNAEIFQIRFKLDNAKAYEEYDPTVYLTYLPSGSQNWCNSSAEGNPWKETIKASISKEYLDGGSLEGEYVTLTVDLSSKKISTCGTIKAIGICFGYLRGGTATVDHIYIGRKTHSLYFGFEKDASTTHYVEGAYGGHDFDDPVAPAWATSCTQGAGGFYRLDHTEGTMTLYTCDDYTGTLGEGEINGAYLGTSAISGSYAFTDHDNRHPLSFDPSEAEILEIRFKTEDLVAQEDHTPLLTFMCVQDEGGIAVSNTECRTNFTIQNGEYQTVRIPIKDSVRAADYIRSVGIRFAYTKNKNPSDFAKIIVDYIYLGTTKDAPSNLFIDFTNKDTDQERYLSQTYGAVNLDKGGWINCGRLTAPVFSSAGEGTMTLTVDPEAALGALYAQTSVTINKTLWMDYDTTGAEIIQFRFKLKNFKANGTPKVGLYFYSTDTTHPLGSDTLKNAGTSVYEPAVQELNSGEYITVTMPVSESLKDAGRVTSLRFNVSGVESISATEPGQITVDYIYMGSRAEAPTGTYTVTFLGADGAELSKQTFVKGEAAIYSGLTPTKAPDAENHYVFKCWDSDLVGVAEDAVVTAQFTAEAHSFTNGLCVCGEKDSQDPILHNSLMINHTLNLASDISVNLAVAKSLLEGFDMDTVYVLTEMETYEGNTKTGTTTVKLLPVDRGHYYYFTLTGLTAVQINDRLSSVLYGTKDGQPYYSATDDYSVADYAYFQMDKETMPDTLKVLCADLLRYGASAQIFKSYRTDALADAAMTEAHKAYLSNMEAISFGNTNATRNDLTDPTITWSGKSLNLESKVALKFVFSTAGYSGNLEDLNLRVSYTNMEGKVVTTTVSQLEAYNAANDLYAFSFSGFLAAELRSVVSVQVYEKDTPVSCTLEYSADTYGNNRTGTLLTLCKALFAYSDSAKRYFL